MDLKVLSRYVGSNAAAGMTVLVVLGALTPDQSQTVVAALHQIYNDVHDAMGAFAKIWVIVFPLISVWLAKMGLNSTRVNALVTKLLGKANGDSPEAKEAKVAIVNAATAVPGTEKVINPTLAADPATSPKVTVS